jgi:hypothetical protein
MFGSGNGFRHRGSNKFSKVGTVDARSESESNRRAHARVRRRYDGRTIGKTKDTVDER